MTRTKELPFIKMHGLGNDFIVLDGRDGSPVPDAQQMQALAHRHLGLGCDQLMVLMPAAEGVDVCLDMFNADGSIAGACGNGTRCVASLLMAEKTTDRVVIRTIAGDLPCWQSGKTGQISVQMGLVNTGWQDIPLTRESDTLHLDLGLADNGLADLGLAVAVSVGNPHAVFFVEDAEAVDIETYGPLAEQHPIFSDRANIEFVSLKNRREMRMRVWERGVGVTMACGSGACAAAAAGVLRGLCDNQVRIELDGGILDIHWQEADSPAGGRIIMTGPVATVASGIIPARFFAALTRTDRAER